MRDAAITQRSYLIQRLKKPRKAQEGHPLFGKDNPFSFGGGLHNGGLSGEAMDLLRGIWQFDYMGAAEFEWGAVPEALSKMAKADLVASSFSIPLREVAKQWRDKSKKEPDGEATVYVLAPAGWENEIEHRVRAWAADSNDDEFRLKEYTRLAAAIRPAEEWDKETCGWLELDNGYAFFTDREMWEQASALFGVATEELAA